MSRHYHPEGESSDYESDHIDEEIEHRLYSMIHHHSDDPVVVDNINNKGDTQNNNQQPTPSIIYLSDSDEDTTTATTTTAQDEPVTIDTTNNNNNNNNSTTAKRNLWHIDYKDYLVANPIHGKFYRPRIWCSRCKKEGNHPVKLCHLPKHKICYICGGVGHLGHHCQNQHCKRCMDFHSTSHCNLNVREYKCRICSKYGHLDDVCPNHWRRFHNITDPQVDPNSTNTQIQKNINKSCSICGRHQHYSFECDRLRNRPIEISSPYDINTTFGGKIIPIIRKKTSPTVPSTTTDIYQRFKQGYKTPQSTKFFGRPSRYFVGEPYSLVDQPNTSRHQTPNTNQVVPQPQSNNHNNNNTNRSPKKKPKMKKKRNNKQLVKISTDNEMIKGGSIRSGKVKKSKARQQQRRKQKKQNLKMQQQFMRQQSRQSMNQMVYETFNR